MMDGIIDGVNARAQALIDAMVGAITAARDAANRALDAHSPSRVFMAIGASTMEGAIIGIERKQDLLAQALEEAFHWEPKAAHRQAVLRAYEPAERMHQPSLAHAGAAPATRGGGGDRTVTNRFGDVTIANGMDLAAFDQRVKRIVERVVR
jgi:hypothetical protein